MSNALAIAAVTEALVALLTKHLDAARVINASVSNITPDQPGKPANPGVNVFLYQVTPNTARRNIDLPTRAADGTLLRKPVAAVDLHYLLTFYGDDTLLEQQRLLGAVTLALHANPTLPRSAILPVPIGPAIFASSHLETQAELIRFTPVAFSLEELSKLWSFLFKVDYVLSAAYLASVVLMETDDAAPPPALPVLRFTLSAQPLRQPVIAQVVAASDPAALITAGADIALIGRNLTAQPGGATQVLINGTTRTPGSIGANRITLALPAGLAAGPQTAQVMQPLTLGVPAVAHPGTGNASGLAAFVLHPRIAPGAIAGSFAVAVQTGGSPPVQELVMTVIPTVRQGQRVLVQLLPQANPAATRLFDGGSLTVDSATLTVPIPGVVSGTYVVRVLIDGAESPLVLGAGGIPVAPSVTV